MKGFVFHNPGSGEVNELPIKKLGPRDVLVKVAYCGICGTDMNIWRGTDRSANNIVLGHEYSGTIVEVGNDVQDFHTGDRVAIDPNIPCGKCEACRKGRINLCKHLTALGVDIDGGFAEYCVVPETQLYSIPDTMSFEEAAMIEPVACAINGINRVNINIGDDVLILGGGPMGLLMLQLARLRGAGRAILCEKLEKRRQIGATVGADIVVDDLGKVEYALMGKPDVVIECIGNPITQKSAFDLVKPGGSIELFGDGDLTKQFTLPSMIFYDKELTVTGAALNPYTHSQALRTLKSGRLNVLPLISSKIHVDELPETLIKGYGKDDVKILVSFE